MTLSPQQVEATPDFQVPHLLTLARLLTGDNSDLITPVADSKCDTTTGPFVDLMNSLTGSATSPPTYTGDDPIKDILTIIGQLAACQKPNSFLSKIGDFFTGRDGGRMLRRLLLQSRIAIECLSLWYSMKVNGLIDDPSEMQAFCSDALGAGSLSAVDRGSIPSAIRQAVVRSHSWDQSMSTVLSFFSVGTASPAPALLAFNDRALDAVLQHIESTGSLPPQQASSSSSMSNATIPVAFVPGSQLKDLLGQYLNSGTVNPAAT